MRIIFRTDAAHSQPCICDNYDGQIYELDDIDLPYIPCHPNCNCHWFDADTGEDLGTDLFIISQLSEKPLDQSDIEKLKRLQYQGESMAKEAKYVAFNPSSGENSEYVTGNTLEELLINLGARAYLEVDTLEKARDALKKEGYGRWVIEDLEVYDLTKHPKLKEQMKSW